jgi:hypothetical protein
MSHPVNGIAAYPDTERSVTGPFTGVAQNLGGVLTENPIIVILDNQSTVSAQLYMNGVLFKTFAASEALVLDMRGNNGIASTYTFPLNAQFSVIATGGTGSFYMSILFAR